jgi:serine protease
MEIQFLRTTADIRHVRVMSGNAQVVEVIGLSGLDRAQTISTINSIAQRIAADPAVEYAEPDAFMQIQQAVNDPQFGQQWHYTTPVTGVNVIGGWSNSTGGRVWRSCG